MPQFVEGEEAREVERTAVLSPPTQAALARKKRVPTPEKFPEVVAYGRLQPSPHG